MSADISTLTLADGLDMTAARPLAAELAARRGRPLSLDASAVRRVGGQCLQVLLAARTAWAADGQPFEVSQASTEWRDGVALMGCSDLAALASDQD